ncbi:PEP-CTERM sorting domain-containing protein [Anatilimnocola sp. NA78]|uniref:PEP-CTERM sorting domain-containing protein n=1 Tax=Anatilimnocola sp. NA78 TaxID=3415683 RepID=UPI003CE50C96
MKQLRPLIAAAVAILLSVATANASIIAYDNDANAAPLQNYGGSLGLDFDVNQTIAVTSLGAFFGNNINNLESINGGGVTVGIYDRNTELLVGSSVLINSSTYTHIVNGNAFLALNSPLVLGPGNYSVVAFSDPNYNSMGSANLFSTMNDGGGVISFVGTGRYDPVAGIYPEIIDAGPANRYAAGTFEFAPVPEPTTMAIWGIGAAGCALLGYRRRKQPV